MMDSLIQWSVNNRYLVVVIAVVFSVFGLYVCATVPVDVFPDLTAPTVAVLISSCSTKSKYVPGVGEKIGASTGVGSAKHVPLTVKKARRQRKRRIVCIIKN